jgi:hypothetical protein
MYAIRDLRLRPPVKHGWPGVSKLHQLRAQNPQPVDIFHAAI